MSTQLIGVLRFGGWVGFQSLHLLQSKSCSCCNLDPIWPLPRCGSTHRSPLESPHLFVQHRSLCTVRESASAQQSIVTLISLKFHHKFYSLFSAGFVGSHDLPKGTKEFSTFCFVLIILQEPRRSKSCCCDLNWAWFGLFPVEEALICTIKASTSVNQFIAAPISLRFRLYLYLHFSVDFVGSRNLPKRTQGF